MDSKKDYTKGSIWGLELFQKFYDFDKYIEPIIERFPSFEKSAWCAEIKRLIIETIRLIIKTNKSRNKLPGWFEIDTNLDVLRIYIRRMREKKYLSPRSYETAIKRLAEVGKILGGLINPDNGDKR